MFEAITCWRKARALSAVWCGNASWHRVCRSFRSPLGAVAARMRSIAAGSMPAILARATARPAMGRTGGNFHPSPPGWQPAFRRRVVCRPANFAGHFAARQAAGRRMANLRGESALSGGIGRPCSMTSVDSCRGCAPASPMNPAPSDRHRPAADRPRRLRCPLPGPPGPGRRAQRGDRRFLRLQTISLPGEVSIQVGDSPRQRPAALRPAGSLPAPAPARLGPRLGGRPLPRPEPLVGLGAGRGAGEGLYSSPPAPVAAGQLIGPRRHPPRRRANSPPLAADVLTDPTQAVGYAARIGWPPADRWPPATCACRRRWCRASR